jgi:hypothetical protein
VIITELKSRPDPNLAAKLETFESQFHYPLGRDAWFRISHGDDYTRFFRAIGQARCFVALRGSEVLGVISAMICRLRTPGGDWQQTGYISDLKISQSFGGRTLLRLLRTATDWVQPSTPAFCVVMDGTAKDPSSYTGRLGVPQFRPLCKLLILRIPCESFALHARVPVEVHPTEVVKTRYRELTPECFATTAGDSALRSEMQPLGLISTDGNASGLLEDTRRGKQLFNSDGTEMISAHLSCFGYRDATAAVDLIAAAAGHCQRLEIPALFVAIPDNHADAMLNKMPTTKIVKAPAIVFGYAFDQPGTWSINTAEI